MNPQFFKDYDNFALLFHKPRPSDLLEGRRGKKLKTFLESKNHPLKSKGLVENKALRDFEFLTTDFQKQCQRLREGAIALLPSGNFRVQEYQCERPLAIGMGTPSFYENGIQLHHIYGFPYLPASSIKGAVRWWTIYRYFDNKEQRAWKDADFCQLFGDSAEESGKDFPNIGRSKLLFWDAFPTTAPRLKVALLNSHFPKYYSGKEAPTDTQDPNPVNFLVVDSGTIFQFILGQRKTLPLEGKLHRALPAGVLDKESPTALLDLVSYLLEESLQHWGIGAKTSLSYGKMKRIN